MSEPAGRICVVMPVYKAQGDFEDTLRSLESPGVPLTVFAVDDGSEPPLEVPEETNVRVKLIRLAHNQGIVAALNAGLRAAIEAGCEYIGRIDAGDYAAPGRFSKQAEYLDTHPNCMLVGSDVEVRDETGQYCFTIRPPREPGALANALHERVWLMHPSVMYRAEVFREVGFYSNEFAAAEDYDMFLRIATAHEVGTVPEPLLTYVVRRGSISGRKARVQLVSRLRIQLRYFKWTTWWSYFGVIRTAGTLLMPRALVSSFKLRFLYSRTSNRSVQA